jgi:hypothetical protein
MITVFATLATKIANSFKAETGKEQAGRLKQVFTGGSGSEWIPLGRQKQTLRFRDLRRGPSGPFKRGKVKLEGTDIPWVQFSWPDAINIDGCEWSSVGWRFYQNGLVSLSAELSKKDSGFDLADLLGHTVELRDKSGFVVGVWSAAFYVLKGSETMAYQSSATEDFAPLKLHFNELADVQTGCFFRI